MRPPSSIENEETYANTQQEGTFPADLKALRDAGQIDADAIKSPFGAPGDGGPDIFYRANVSEAMPAETIWAYDRASYANADTVAALFIDGRVETMSRADFETVLKQSRNAGVDFNLPKRMR